MPQNVLMLLAPDEDTFYFGRKNMPPLAIGEIQGYLREKGFTINSYDLNYYLAKNSENYSRDKWSILFDKEFIFRNLENDTLDDEVDQIPGQLIHKIDFSDADVIGISVGGNFSFFEVHAAFLLGKMLKQKYNKPIVFGGTNITYLYLFRDAYMELWQRIFQNFEYVILGPGERSFEKLLHAFEKGNVASEYKKLNGAIYFQGDELTSNTEDMPTLSRPDFSGLNLDFYSTCIHANDQKLTEDQYYKWPYPFYIMASELNRQHLNAEKKEVIFLPYIFNYHCPYNCAFCEESYEKKRVPCSKNAVNVVDDIQRLINTYDTKYFYFFNNTFNFRTSFVREFCNLVIERKLEFYWNDCARVNGMTKELLELMYKAGCRKLIFGLETASEKLLKYVNKKLNVEQVKKVLIWCSEVGISADLEVIIGFPYEYEDDFQATCQFITDNKHLINSFQLNRYFVVPSSLMGTYPEKYGIKLKPHQSYEMILDRNRLLFKENYFSSKREVGETNFQIIGFDEINGRQYSQTVKETKDRIHRMSKILFRLPVFKEATTFLASHRFIRQMIDGQQ